MLAFLLLLVRAAELIEVLVEVVVAARGGSAALLRVGCLDMLQVAAAGLLLVWRCCCRATMLLPPFGILQAFNCRQKLPL